MTIGRWLFNKMSQMQINRFRRTGGQKGGTLRGMPVLLLTTIGRKSGKERVTPVMYIRDGDNYVITASKGGADTHPDWYRNLMAHPQTTIEVGDKTLRVHASQATPEQKAPLWAELVRQAPFFGDYQTKTTREIPMIILRPTDH